MVELTLEPPGGFEPRTTGVPEPESHRTSSKSTGENIEKL